MYQRTSRAAVWRGSADEIQPVAQAGGEFGTREQTIWAKVPFQAKRGRCVAVRRRGDVLWIGLAGSPAVQWVPVRQALTDAEATAWLATGF